MKGWTREQVDAIKDPTARAQAQAAFKAAPLASCPIVISLKIPAQKCPKTKGKKPNKTESAYNAEWLDGKGLFNAITFRLQGGSRYTPDWYLFDGGAHSVIEVKGSYRHPTRGRSLTAFKEARSQFPGFIFTWVERQADGTFKERSV